MQYDSVRVVVMYDDAEEQRELLGCACVADVSRKDKTAGQQLLVRLTTHTNYRVVHVKRAASVLPHDSCGARVMPG